MIDIVPLRPHIKASGLCFCLEDHEHGSAELSTPWQGIYEYWTFTSSRSLHMQATSVISMAWFSKCGVT